MEKMIFDMFSQILIKTCTTRKYDYRFQNLFQLLRLVDLIDIRAISLIPMSYGDIHLMVREAF